MNSEQIERLYYKNLDTANRTIFFMPWQPSDELVSENLSWEVNDFTIQNLLKGLYILDKSSHQMITILWLSYGGCWSAGMAIYDFIMKMKSPVTLKAYGRIRSMGTIILQACKNRYLSQNCEFLIHYGTGIGEGESAHTKDLIMSAKEAEKCNTVMEDIFLKRIRQKKRRYTRDSLKELMKYDKYLLPKEAIELGLADKII